MKLTLRVSKPGNQEREGGHEINPPSILARKSGKGRAAMKLTLRVSKPGNQEREGGHEINPPSIQARKSGKGRRS